MCGTIIQLATIAATATQAAGQITQGVAARRAGRARKSALEAQAARRGERAGAEERDFRRRASRLLARQRALFAASGVSTEGSPTAVGGDTAAEAELQARRILRAGLSDAELLRFQGSLESQKGESAFLAGLTGAGTTLLTGARRLPFGSPAAPTIPRIATNPGERFAGRN